MSLRYPRGRRKAAVLINSCCFPIWLLITVLGFQSPHGSPQDAYLAVVQLVILVPWAPAVAYDVGIEWRHIWRKKMRKDRA